MKSADARIAGKRYLDQFLVLSSDDSIVKEVQDRFGCARLFHDCPIRKDIDKKAIIQFYSKELKVL